MVQMGANGLRDRDGRRNGGWWSGVFSGVSRDSKLDVGFNVEHPGAKYTGRKRDHRDDDGDDNYDGGWRPGQER